MRPEAYLTVRQVCERLVLRKPDAILSAIHAGELSAVNVSAGTGRPTWRIAVEDLDAWLARRRAAPAPTAKRRTRRTVGARAVTRYF